MKLPKYQPGTTTAIVYTIAETTGYAHYTASTTDPVASGESITNKQDETEAYAKKAWKNADGSTTAPSGASVVYTLYANSEATKYTVTLDGTADASAPDVTGGYESEPWKAMFVHLPEVDKDGKKITYTIAETTGYDLYMASTEEPVESGETITNIRITGDLEVTKTVVSKVEGDDKAAFEFTVTLSDTTIEGTYGDMTFTAGKATFKLKNGETATATGLPTEVTFTVTETENPDFTTTMTGDTGTIATTTSKAEFTNTRITTAVTVKKVWEDNNNSGKKRPASLKVTLKANGKEIKTVTLNEGNKWKTTVSDLPFSEGGKKITYTWTEEEIKNYTLTSTKTSTDGLETTLTNKVKTTPGGGGTPFTPDDDLGMGMLINVGDCLE